MIKSIKNIVLIDHHRMAVDSVENVIIEYHEVYASSAAELVTELIQYSEKVIELSPFESECIYGGILLDTKNFTFRTGVRTFEAAAYLRKYRPDIIKVQKWFQSDLESFNTITEIIKDAEEYKSGIVIVKYDKKDSEVIIAQTADKLLQISNIKASFVIGRKDKDIIISARSIGNINVQVIMEALRWRWSYDTCRSTIRK